MKIGLLVLFFCCWVGVAWGQGTKIIELEPFDTDSIPSYVKARRYVKFKINKANLVTQTDRDHYFFANNADTEIRYDDVFRGSWFIGITYNLSK